jgi:hypothetical protein
MTTDLLGAFNLLADGLRADPLLSLASAVCWLDPLWRDDGEDADVPYDTDGILAAALGITRRTFPEVYMQAVNAIRQGASYAEIDRLICEAVTARGIPLDGIEFMAYGIPLPAYGAALSDPDFYERHPDTLPVLACFGITPDPEAYAIDVPDLAYTAAQRIAADLEQQTDAGWQQIGWLLRWLFSCSGNSSVDYDDETMSGFQPLAWEPDDIAFAVEIIAEAETIMRDALAGLALLNGQPELTKALQQNVERITRSLDKRSTKGNLNEPHFRLEWPPARRGDHGTAVPDPQLLQLRDPAA